MSEWPAIKTIVQNVNNGTVTALENVQTALKQIESKKEYCAIISTTTERALVRAQAIDAKVAKTGNAGRLAGVPFIAKDNFLVFGSNTTAASNILKNFNAPYQATAIEKLEAEGAICVAKANMDAFGHGTTTEKSDFFPTLNPHDKSRVPGGSSGGSAAAVMLDIVPFATGTDTGGSLRMPAHLTGAVGYKPSYGLVSRSGVVAMASSTDCVGALTKNVDDLGLVLDVMAGKDPLDSTTINKDDAGYTNLTGKLKGKTVGVIKEYMDKGLDDAVRRPIQAAIAQLKKSDVNVKEISLPSIPLSLAVYYIVVPAEISSNLSRYDGQRFGYSDKDAGSLDESYTHSRSMGFGREAKRRIMIGTYVLSSGYYDAYYNKAQTVRTKLINEFEHAFKSVDFLIGPTGPSTAYKLGETTADPLKMYLEDVMTVAASLVGIPAIVIPVGEKEKLPVGLQIMAGQKHDRELLNFAKAVEEVLV